MSPEKKVLLNAVEEAIRNVVTTVSRTRYDELMAQERSTRSVSQRMRIRAQRLSLVERVGHVVFTYRSGTYKVLNTLGALGDFKASVNSRKGGFV